MTLKLIRENDQVVCAKACEDELGYLLGVKREVLWLTETGAASGLTVFLQIFG